MLIQRVREYLTPAVLTIILIMLFIINVIGCTRIIQTYSWSNNDDWVIDRNIIIENVEKHIKKNIIIESNATLVIVNSIIYIDSEYNGELSIIVNKEATLEIINSTIRSGTNKTYLFYVYGTLIMKESILRDCGIQYDKPGLVIDGSEYTIIKDSLIMGNYAGITIRRSTNIEITGNKIYANVYGVLLSNSRNILIKNNRFIANSYDLYSFNSTTLNISNNYFEGGGLYMDRNTNNLIIDNEFINTGISISGDKILYYRHEFEGNIINNKPLIYLFNKSRTIITGEIGMAIVVSSQNVIINNVSIYNTTVGIGLYFSSNILINDSIIESNRIGVEIKFSKKVTIVNSRLEKNRMYGLKLYNTQEINTQYNNIILNSLSGILIMDSSNIYINYNNITKNNGYGIYVQDSNNIDARYNWWGTTQGPEYKEQSDSNEPEEIYSSNTNNFYYEPWLKKPITSRNIEIYYREEALNTAPYIIALITAIIFLGIIRYYLKYRKSKNL